MLIDLLLKLMEWIELFRWLHFGVSPNCWGLGCPSYCYPAAWPTVRFAFLCGLLTGLILAFFLLWRLGLLPAIGFVATAPPEPIQPVPARLRGYVHANRPGGLTATPGRLGLTVQGPSAEAGELLIFLQGFRPGSAGRGSPQSAQPSSPVGLGASPSLRQLGRLAAGLGRSWRGV